MVPIHTVFGNNSVAYIFQSKRVDLLHSRLFDIATRHRTRHSIVTQVDNYQNTLLHEALLKERKENAFCLHFRRRVVKLIPFFKGETINQQNKDGNTPLHLAIEVIPDKNTLLRFLEMGARLDIRNNEGLTPLQMDDKYSMSNNLIRKLVEDKDYYLIHRQTLLTFIDDLKNPYNKIAVLKAAFCFELSNPSPNIDIISKFLSSEDWISISIGDFAILAKIALEHVLVYEKMIGDERLKSNFAQLPLEIQQGFLKYELNKQEANNENIILFLKNIFGSPLQQLTPAEIEVLLSKFLVIDTLSDDDHAIVKGYLSCSLEQLALYNDADISPQRVALLLNPDLSGILKEKILRVAAQLEAYKSFQSFFKRDHTLTDLLNQLFILRGAFYSVAPLDAQGDRTLMRQVSQLSVNHVLSESCGLGNGLSIAEQIMRELYTACQQNNNLSFLPKSVILEKIVPFLDFKRIKKIADSLGDRNNAQSEAAIYDLLVQYAVYQPEVDWDLISSIPFSMINWQKIDDLTGLSFAEQLFIAIDGRTNFTADKKLKLLEVLVSHLTFPLMGTLSKLATYSQHIDSGGYSYDKYLKKQSDFLYKIVLLESEKGMQANVRRLIEVSFYIDVFQILLPNGLSVAEQFIAQAYILTTRNPSLSPREIALILDRARPFLRVPINESIHRIVNSFSTHPNRSFGEDGEKIKNAIYHLLIKHELEEVSRFNLTAIWAIASEQGMSLKADCGLGNGLNILEQAILSIYFLEINNKISRDGAFSKLNVLFEQLDSPLENHFKKIIDSLLHPPNNKFLLVASDVESWLYQSNILSDRRKGYVDRQKVRMQLSLATRYQGTSQFSELSAAEEIISYAMFHEDEQMFNQAYHALIENGQSFSVDRLMSQASFYNQNAALQWLHQVRANADRCMEVKKLMLEGRYQEVFDFLKSQAYLSLQSDSGVGNGLTFAEQILAQCYISAQRSTDLNTIKELLPKLMPLLRLPIDDSLRRIVTSFSTQPNANASIQPSFAELKLWFYTVIISTDYEHVNELRLVNRYIFDCLSQDIDYHVPNPLGAELTLAEQSLRAAILSYDSLLLEVALLKFNETDRLHVVEKIIQRCPDPKKALVWFSEDYQNIESLMHLREAFRKGAGADPEFILKNFTIYNRDEDGGLGNGLTVVEQLFAQAYVLKSPCLLVATCKRYVDTIIFPDVGKVVKRFWDPLLDIEASQAMEREIRQWYDKNIRLIYEMRGFIFACQNFIANETEFNFYGMMANIRLLGIPPSEEKIDYTLEVLCGRDLQKREVVRGIIHTVLLFLQGSFNPLTISEEYLQSVGNALLLLLDNEHLLLDRKFQGSPFSLSEHLIMCAARLYDKPLLDKLYLKLGRDCFLDKMNGRSLVFTESSKQWLDAYLLDTQRTLMQDMKQRLHHDEAASPPSSPLPK